MYLSFAQQQAVILGDTSGSFIHPFFIKFAHLVGCHFHRRYCSDNSLMQLETSYLFSVLRALASMKEEADPVSYVHAHWLVAMACVTTGNSPKAVRFMKEAANSVERNRDLFLSKLPGLSSVPVTVTVDYSEDLHERLGLLAHILWFRTYMSIYLVDSGFYPMPNDAPGKIPVSVSLNHLGLPFTRGSSNRFWRSSKTFSTVHKMVSSRALLICFKITCRLVPSLASGAACSSLCQVACPVLFEVCPLMVRVRTMLLIRKSRKLIAQHLSERKRTSMRTFLSLIASLPHIGTPRLAWLTQCSEICTELGERVQLLAKLITRFAAANDHDSCVSLRLCSLVCLSNLGELYHILSHHPLWNLQTVAMKQHEQAMYRLSEISKELTNGNDMRHLPPYAGVSTPAPRFCWFRLIFLNCWQCSWARAAILLRREIAMMARDSYTPHPEKSIDELRQCIGATIDFMTATSTRFYSASSFENPSRNWGDLIPTD